MRVRVSSGSHSPLSPAPIILASSLAFSISAYVFALICVPVVSVKGIASSAKGPSGFGPLASVPFSVAISTSASAPMSSSASTKRSNHVSSGNSRVPAEFYLQGV